MKLWIIMLAALLTGCTCSPTKLDQEVVVKYKYVVTTIPDSMLVVPDPMYRLDVNVATDKDASKWLIDSERRYLEVEKKLRSIKQYQADQLKSLNIPKEDLIQR